MRSRTARWSLLLVSVLLGIGGGIAYGWLVNPVNYSNTRPDTLGLDYQTDYVLMAAEIFRVEGDINQAVERLSFPNPESMPTLLQTTLTQAKALQYDPGDIRLIQALTIALDEIDLGQP